MNTYMMTCQTGSKLHKKVCGEIPQRIVLILLTHHQELTQVAVLDTDLSTIPTTSFDQFENPKTKQPYYVTYLTCKMLLSGTSLEVQIYWNEKRMCSTMIEDIR
jgi:hypothetical protein